MAIIYIVIKEEVVLSQEVLERAIIMDKWGTELRSSGGESMEALKPTW